MSQFRFPAPGPDRDGLIKAPPSLLTSPSQRQADGTIGIVAWLSRSELKPAVDVVSRADDYRAKAEDCRRQAKLSLNPADNEQWLNFAQQWLQMAQQADQQTGYRE